MQKCSGFERQNGGNAERIYSELSPAIRRLAAEPNNWWRTRKRYGKLTEGLVRSYVSTRLRDIRLNGRGEADKAIEKLIFDKKREISGDILEFIKKNRAVWGQFLYDIASRFDTDALVGFFVPLIYGGVISRKNATGELLSAVRFDRQNENIRSDERLFASSGAIGECKRRGNTVIIIEGGVEEVYSDRLLSLYLSSPNEAFIIIERENNKNDSGRAFASGDASYKRETLVALGRAKNVFIVLSCEGKTERIRGKSGALSSYGIPHGFSVNASAMEKGRDNGLLQSVLSIKGGAVAVFDGGSSLIGAMGGTDPASVSAENILSILPSSLTDFLESPSLPVHLPDLFELLSVLQFIVSCGNVRGISTKLV